MKDDLIIDRYLERDEQAIVETKASYGKQLVRLANRIVDDLDVALECENDTYLRAWNSIPPTEPRTYFFAYLAKIIRGIAIDRYKEANRQKRSATMVELTTELSEMLPAKDDVCGSVEANQLQQLINTFLKSLKEEKRNVFIRRYWYMDSIEGIATFYEMSEGKVKTILHRTRNELQQYLEKEGYHL